MIGDYGVVVTLRSPRLTNAGESVTVEVVSRGRSGDLVAIRAAEALRILLFPKRFDNEVK